MVRRNLADCFRVGDKPTGTTETGAYYRARITNGGCAGITRTSL